MYRSYKWESRDPTVQEPFLSGTYYNPVQITAGYEGANALVLVDSHEYSSARHALDYNAAGTLIRYVLGTPATPESPAKGVLVKAVDVNCHIYQPGTAWFGTAILHLGMRIVVAAQDPETGAMLQQPFYSMWENAGGDQATGPDMWANGRQNCWEFRKSYIPMSAGNANTPALATWVRARARFRRRLEANEALFLWVELHPSSNPGTLNLFNPFCRTLVQPPD